MSSKTEFACDRCDATLFAYKDEPLLLGLGCSCGGAWIDIDLLDPPMCGEPESDFPTLFAREA